MPQITEAACLLQSGAMYTRRLGLRTRSGDDIFAGVKPGGVSIYFGDAPIYHFDLDGRWQRAYFEGKHYLKGLDATVRSIDRERESGALVLRRETLPYALAADLDDSIRSVALDLIQDLDSGRFEIQPTPPKARGFTPGDFREFFERAGAWDSAAWFAHRERYLATYGPPPFLPPDCPNPLLLQATLGHADGRAFGRSRPAEHYVRSSEEFRDHLRAVVRLTGRRISQHKEVFLAGADILHRPMAEVLDRLHAVEEFLPIGPLRSPDGDRWDDFPAKPSSVHAFLDDFSPPVPDLEGWRALRSARLERVTLGIESGDLAIRAAFGKFWRDGDFRSIVSNLKAAEIGVGLVVLVGAGDRDATVRHVEATASLLGSLALGRSELVSLVDVRNLDESSGENTLTDQEAAGQVAMLKERLSQGPKVVAYNPLKRWA